jgi:DNA-binding HxlR family transcriptional regulator
MPNPIQNLDKTFDNRLRLGIIALLSVNENIDFNTLKSTLQATDGNLASHLSALENAGYIKVSKQFIGRKPNTSYSITETGRTAFSTHIKALEELIKSNT